MNEINKKIREISTIAIGVALIIGGGAAIYMFSAAFPIPGVKFIIMSPYLATVFYIIQSKVNSKFTLLKMGVVFAFIMVVINVFMGIAILLTTLFTHISVMFIRSTEQRIFWGSVLFSGYTGIFALLVTKLFIGGVLGNISFTWVLVVGLICACFGVAGTFVARKALRHMKVII